MASFMASRLTAAFLIMACLLFVISTVTPISAAPVAAVGSPSVDASSHKNEIESYNDDAEPYNNDDESYNDDVGVYNDEKDNEEYYDGNDGSYDNNVDSYDDSEESNDDNNGSSKYNNYSDDVGSYYEEEDHNEVQAEAVATGPVRLGIQKRGHGCWKGNSIECNRFCVGTLGKRGGYCRGFLGQTCTCF
jgi:hypothetical protein